MTNDILVKTENSPMEKAQKLMELQDLVNKIKPEVERLREELLKVTQDLGVLTLKTEKYTISRAHRITPQVINFTHLKESLEKENIPYDTQEVFAPHMNTTFKKLIEDGRILDGLEAKDTEYVMVRIREEK